MHLQQFTISSDYSHRPIDSLHQKPNPNPPRAILVYSTRTTGNPVSPLYNHTLLVPKTSPDIAHIRKPMENGIQSQLQSYRHFDLELKPLVKTRKFAEFSVGEEVAIGRTTSLSQSHHPNLESTRTPDNPLDSFLPVNPILSSVGQPTIQNPEEHYMSSNLHHPATLSKSESLSTSLQLAENLETNASARNWPHALLTIYVVGVAAVAVVTGYACSTVFRGVMNVGHFIYSNKLYSQPTIPPSDVWSLSANYLWVSVAALQCHRYRKAAASSATFLGTSEYQSSQPSRRAQLRRHFYQRGCRVLSTILSPIFYRSQLVQMQ